MVRFTLLISIVAGLLLMSGCGTKDRSLSGRIVGTWEGESSVEQTFTDSGGFSFTQTFESPLKLDYSADSTLTITLTVSETNIYQLVGKTKTEGEILTFTGKLTMGEVLDVSGEISLNSRDELVLSYTGYSDVGIEHKAEALLSRVK